METETIPAWRVEYLAKRKALAELMEAHKVTIAARRVDTRPDGDSDWHKSAAHAAFDVLHNGRVVYSGHYSAGSKRRILVSRRLDSSFMVTNGTMLIRLTHTNPRASVLSSTTGART